MDIKKIYVLCFSPTGGTARIAQAAADVLARRLGAEQKRIDFTLPPHRQTQYRFRPDELLVMASPVYAGRLPNKLLPEYKSKIFGENTPAVPLCVFGNRSPDGALRELVLLLRDERNGLERVLLHFSHFEKVTRRLDSRLYEIRLRYDPADETELLIRILSFGPVLEVRSPPEFAALVRERICIQQKILPKQKQKIR